MSYLPIGDHGVIGNLHTAALVGMEGTIDWLCLPAFDSPAVFCSILDDERGGRFTLRPVDYERSQQLYLPDSNVLLTRFFSSGGMAEVIDYMPILSQPGDRSRLVRDARVVRGTMRFEVECRPSFDYARGRHHVSVGKNGAVFAAAGAAHASLALSTAVPLEEWGGGGAGAKFTLEEGARAAFVLSEVEDGEGPGAPFTRARFEESLHATLGYWRRWIAGSTYSGRWREYVHRSALVLKLMVYDPTGALVAAPTMGLPESIGGGRNWDYRYAWLRDAAFTLYALISIGFDDEAYRFMGWLRDRCALDEDGLLQPLYGIDGRTEIVEEDLGHLSGYMGSKPVRLGNAAYGQLQLDLYGAILDAAYLYNKHGAPLDYDLWQNLRRILDWLCDNWHFEDEGIWEVRGGRRHFVSSKVMSWVALERAVRISRQRGLPAGNGGETRWIAERDKSRG